MPIDKNWSKATSDHIRKHVPEKGGVYELKSFGEHVYIGKASNLQRRLLEHLAKNPSHYRFERSTGLFNNPTKLENKHFTRYGRSDDELPAWNNNDTR